VQAHRVGAKIRLKNWPQGKWGVNRSDKVGMAGIYFKIISMKTFEHFRKGVFLPESVHANWLVAAKSLTAFQLSYQVGRSCQFARKKHHNLKEE
jgi:hypothetical protein